jgi:hypothetical protein
VSAGVILLGGPRRAVWCGPVWGSGGARGASDDALNCQSTDRTESVPARAASRTARREAATRLLGALAAGSLASSSPDALPISRVRLDALGQTTGSFALDT